MIEGLLLHFVCTWKHFLQPAVYASVGREQTIFSRSRPNDNRARFRKIDAGGANPRLTRFRFTESANDDPIPIAVPFRIGCRLWPIGSPALFASKQERASSAAANGCCVNSRELRGA